MKTAQKGGVPPFTLVLSTISPLPRQYPTAPTNAPPTLYTGTWKKEGDKYQVSITVEGGEKTGEVSFVDGGKLAATVGANTLVFNRIP